MKWKALNSDDSDTESSTADLSTTDNEWILKEDLINEYSQKYMEALLTNNQELFKWLLDQDLIQEYIGDFKDRQDDEQLLKAIVYGTLRNYTKSQSGEEFVKYSLLTLSIDETDEEIWQSLGKEYLRQGKVLQALNCFQKSISQIINENTKDYSKIRGVTPLHLESVKLLATVCKQIGYHDLSNLYLHYFPQVSLGLVDIGSRDIAVKELCFNHVTIQCDSVVDLIGELVEIKDLFTTNVSVEYNTSGVPMTATTNNEASRVSKRRLQQQQSAPVAPVSTSSSSKEVVEYLFHLVEDDSTEEYNEFDVKVLSINIPQKNSVSILEELEKKLQQTTIDLPGEIDVFSAINFLSSFDNIYLNSFLLLRLKRLDLLQQMRLSFDSNPIIECCLSLIPLKSCVEISDLHLLQSLIDYSGESICLLKLVRDRKALNPKVCVCDYKTESKQELLGYIFSADETIECCLINKILIDLIDSMNESWSSLACRRLLQLTNQLMQPSILEQAINVWVLNYRKSQSLQLLITGHEFFQQRFGKCPKALLELIVEYYKLNNVPVDQQLIQSLHCLFGLRLNQSIRNHNCSDQLEITPDISHKLLDLLQEYFINQLDRQESLSVYKQLLSLITINETSLCQMNCINLNVFLNQAVSFERRLRFNLQLCPIHSLNYFYIGALLAFNQEEFELAQEFLLMDLRLNGMSIESFLLYFNSVNELFIESESKSLEMFHKCVNSMNACLHLKPCREFVNRMGMLIYYNTLITENKYLYSLRFCFQQTENHLMIANCLLKLNSAPFEVCCQHFRQALPSSPFAYYKFYSFICKTNGGFDHLKYLTTNNNSTIQDVGLELIERFPDLAPRFRYRLSWYASTNKLQNYNELFLIKELFQLKSLLKVATFQVDGYDYSDHQFLKRSCKYFKLFVDYLFLLDDQESLATVLRRRLKINNEFPLVSEYSSQWQTDYFDRYVVTKYDTLTVMVDSVPDLTRLLPKKIVQKCITILENSLNNDVPKSCFIQEFQHISLDDLNTVLRELLELKRSIQLTQLDVMISKIYSFSLFYKILPEFWLSKSLTIDDEDVLIDKQMSTVLAFMFDHCFNLLHIVPSLPELKLKLCPLFQQQQQQVASNDVSDLVDLNWLIQRLKSNKV